MMIMGRAESIFVISFLQDFKIIIKKIIDKIKASFSFLNNENLIMHGDYKSFYNPISIKGSVLCVLCMYE